MERINSLIDELEADCVSDMRTAVYELKLLIEVQVKLAAFWNKQAKRGE